jgi:hypothetical protein
MWRNYTPKFAQQIYENLNRKTVYEIPRSSFTDTTYFVQDFPVIRPNFGPDARWVNAADLYRRQLANLQQNQDDEA